MRRIDPLFAHTFVAILALLIASFAPQWSHAQEQTPGVIKMTTNLELGTRVELGIKANGPVEFDGLAGTFVNDDFTRYTILKPEITIRGNVTVFICAEAGVTGLDVSGCPTIDEINCYGNFLSGEATDNLINGLPDRSKEKEAGLIMFFNPVDVPDDQNRCTMAQVAAAQQKGWQTQEWDGKYWNPFLGSDATVGSGLLTFTTAQYPQQYLRIGGTATSLVELQGADGRWINNRSFRILLRSQQVSIKGDLTLLVADETYMTALDASQMPLLERLDCTLNLLKGKALDNLIASLPDRSQVEKKGFLGLLDFTSPEKKEMNVCTKAQVAAAAARGWVVYEWRQEQDKWIPYEGVATVEVTIEQSEGGTIALSGAEDLSAVPMGTQLIAAVSVDSGYELEQLTANDVDLLSTGGVFTVDAPTVVKGVFKKKLSLEEGAAVNMQLYPNPAQDYLVVSGAKENAEYRLINMEGVTLFVGTTSASGSATLDVRSLASGNYILIVDGKTIKTTIARP